ncbi:hypothetical protein vseg_011723 [Gypsophila vaccaria]
MSTRGSTSRTSKHTNVAVLQGSLKEAPQGTMPSVGVCTRGRARKAAVNAAAASLRTSTIPTRPRKFSIASIAAAANAIIEAASPSRKENKTSKIEEVTPQKPKKSSPSKVELASPIFASVMRIEANNLEDQIQEMKRLLEQLRLDNEEKNKKIEDLQKEMGDLRKEDSSVRHTSDAEDDEQSDDDKLPPKNNAVTYTEHQLHELISNTIKSQLSEGSSSNLRYVKPYRKRIDAPRMPYGYQPPKFQQFDGKGNPKQHIAHFIETCNNAGTNGDLLVKQFVRSLKSTAFDWYTDLGSESIDSWDQLENEFLNRFYSTRRIVSMSELTNTTQWEDEPVIEYINRWRALSLECNERLSETSAVEMCINGMDWDLLYILNGIKTRYFQELATRAHNMEITIKGHNKSRSSSSKAYGNMDKNLVDEGSKIISKETMVVNTNYSPFKVSPKLIDSSRDRPTLKELLAKKYTFPDSDWSGMLDDLLEKKVIQLPKPKRPEQVNKTIDPNYCRYHRMVSHPLEKCITLKEKIMQLAKDGKIILDIDEAVTTNHTTVSIDQPDAMNLHDQNEWCVYAIQFGSLEPIALHVRRASPIIQPVLQSVNSTLNDVDEAGWTLVSRRKRRGQQSIPYIQRAQLRRRRVEKVSQHSKRKNKSRETILEEIFSVDYLNHVSTHTITTLDIEENKHQDIASPENSSVFDKIRPSRKQIKLGHIKPPEAYYVFDKIRSSARKSRSSIFSRLGRAKPKEERHTRKCYYVLNRLGNTRVINNKKSFTAPPPKKMGAMLAGVATSTKSVFSRIVAIDHKPSHLTMPNQIDKEVQDNDDLQSVLCSCMKRVQMVDTVQKRFLKAKRRATSLASQQISFKFEDKVREEGASLTCQSKAGSNDGDATST